MLKLEPQKNQTQYWTLKKKHMKVTPMVRRQGGRYLMGPLSWEVGGSIMCINNASDHTLLSLLLDEVI